jgi:prepilin-type processing-associated H-X9-DG protein
MIELLMVVLIIGILVTLLLPALTKARARGQQAACYSNLRQIGFALIMYEHTWNCYPPQRWPRMRLEERVEPEEESLFTYRLPRIPEATNAWGRPRAEWQWALSDYFGMPPQNPMEPIDDPNYRTLSNEVFFCPSFSGPLARDIRDGAYGYNYQYLGNARLWREMEVAGGIILVETEQGLDLPSYNFVNFPVGSPEIVAPFKTVAVADSRGDDIPHGYYSFTLDPPRRRREWLDDISGPTRRPSEDFTPDEAEEIIKEKYGLGLEGDEEHRPNEYGPLRREGLGFSPAQARHLGRVNVLYLDGHVESNSLAELGYVLDINGVPYPDKGDNSRWNGHGYDFIYIYLREMSNVSQPQE